MRGLRIWQLVFVSPWTGWTAQGASQIVDIERARDSIRNPREVIDYDAQDAFLQGTSYGFDPRRLELATSGTRIVDKNTGEEFFLRCVNWSAHMKLGAFYGLHRQTVQHLMAELRTLGVNCLRYNYSLDMLHHKNYKRAWLGDADATVSRRDFDEAFVREWLGGGDVERPEGTSSSGENRISGESPQGVFLGNEVASASAHGTGGAPSSPPRQSRNERLVRAFFRARDEYRANNWEVDHPSELHLGQFACAQCGACTPHMGFRGGHALSGTVRVCAVRRMARALARRARGFSVNSVHVSAVWHGGRARARCLTSAGHGHVPMGGEKQALPRARARVPKTSRPSQIYTSTHGPPRHY